MDGHRPHVLPPTLLPHNNKIVLKEVQGSVHACKIIMGAAAAVKDTAGCGRRPAMLRCRLHDEAAPRDIESSHSFVAAC